jgi:hypothetical protein
MQIVSCHPWNRRERRYVPVTIGLTGRRVPVVQDGSQIPLHSRSRLQVEVGYSEAVNSFI